ncbi:MAG: biopolymer transporter ExbD [Leptospira sp.]|nr:biopolymer transporter ExbD [Leptospira sp.]
MRRRSKRKQIDISSLIDVLFILLIFLMVSVRFTDSHSLVELNLPKSNVSQVGDTKDEIIISISKTGEYFLNGKKESKVIILSFISDELSKMKNPVVILELDEDSRFGDFFEITNLLKSKSIQSVQIATRKK